MLDESMPPDSSAPSGRSASICSETDRVSSVSSSSTAARSSSPRPTSGVCLATDQYARSVTRSLPASRTTIVPGMTFQTPTKIDAGAGT